MRLWIKMPIVGVLPEAAVITIPAYETIEILGGDTHRGLIEVQWGTGRVRVFTDDIAGCCEQLHDPEIGD